jgi:hypothetical protein
MKPNFLTRIGWPVIKAIFFILLFSNIASLIGLLNAVLVRDRNGVELVLWSIPAPCLASLLAIGSWNFRLPSMYWRAPVLCAIAISIGILSRDYLIRFLPDRLAADYTELKLGMTFAIDAFAIFAFVMRAMWARSGAWAPILFFVAAIALAILSADDEIGEYAMMFAVSTFAFRVLPRRKAPSELKTFIVEAR